MSKAATAEMQAQMLTALQALAPATDAVAITPSDTVDLASEATAIACGGSSGAVKLRTAAGNDRTIAIATGQTIAIRFKRVFLTGTSASGLTALMNSAAVAATPSPSPSPTPTPSPTLSLSSAVVQGEGNSGTAAMVWTLTLNRSGSTASFPFNWAVTGSGANPANAADFGGAFPSGSGTFAPGETTKSITVLAMGDTAVEPDETFTLTVTAAGLNTVTSTGTISNDDTSAPTLSLSSAVVQAEGNSGTAALVWTLTLNRDGSTASFPYNWAVTGSGPNPADAADFGGAFPSGSGTFAPGETTKTISVLATGDTAVEPDETFTLSVTANGLNSVTSTGTISNDDASLGLISDVQIMANLTDIATITKPPVTSGDIIALFTMGWVLKVTTSSPVALDYSKVVVNIDRPGYDNKVPTTRRATAIGNGFLRRASPNDATPLPAGANAAFVTLDNWVFGLDTVFSVTFLPGFYPGSPQIEFPGASVVRNDSLGGGLAYPQPTVRIAALPMQVTNGATPSVAIDVTGTSNFARSGRQFDAVEAWCRVGGVDGPAVSTQTMQRSRHTPSSGRLPGKPLPAYLLDPSAASLADGLGGVRIRVYPFCGPVWESWVSGTAFPTANVEAEFPFVNDAAGKFSPLYAWVNQDGTAATYFTGSAISNQLTVSSWGGGANLQVGSVIYCGAGKRTITSLSPSGTGTTGTYTTTEAGNISSGTLFSSGTVQTTSADPGASASFATIAAAAAAITVYNAARTGGLAHSDPDGGVLMFRDVAGSALGAAAGSYSGLGFTVTGGALVPLELRAASGVTSQLCRMRGTKPDNSTLGGPTARTLTGRVRFRNITFDSTGVSTGADNMVFDGGSGQATTKATCLSHLHLIDCDIKESSLGSTSNNALARFSWRNDFRVNHDTVFSAYMPYTSNYQCFVRSIGSAYSHPTVTSMVVPFIGGFTFTNITPSAQQRITVADGGEMVDGYLLVNGRVDMVSSTASMVNMDTPLPLTIGFGMLNFFARMTATSTLVGPGLRLGADGSTGVLANSVAHHVGTDGGFLPSSTSAHTHVARQNYGYNDQLFGAVPKYIQKIGCVIPSLNNKSDTFPAPESMEISAVFTTGARYYYGDQVSDGNATASARIYYRYIGAANRVAVAGDLTNTALWQQIGVLSGLTFGANPIRTGNWAVRNAVGDLGNVVANTADGRVGPPLPTDGFISEKMGRGSAVVTDYTTYYKSPTGGSAFTVSQLGDYRPKSIASGDAVDSPLLNRIPAGRAVRPFDLDGNPVSPADADDGGPYRRAA